MARSLILDPSGNPVSIPTIPLDPADVRLLREYKKLLQRLGLREALYCQECWNGKREDGCEAKVTDSLAVIKCRCTLRIYQGPTY